jgi:hypothetical protein
MLNRFLLAASAILLPIGCGSTEPTARDAWGNYATTSRYRSMNRVDLTAALEAGLADADQRRAELESRARTLGQDAIEELHEQLDDVVQLRTEFVNELARLRASLDDDYPERREDALEAYEDFREALDEAYEEVFEEAT